MGTSETEAIGYIMIECGSEVVGLFDTLEEALPEWHGVRSLRRVEMLSDEDMDRIWKLRQAERRGKKATSPTSEGDGG